MGIALHYTLGVFWPLICSHVLDFTFTFQLPNHAQAYKLFVLTLSCTKRSNPRDYTCVDNGDPEQNEIMFHVYRRRNNCSTERDAHDDDNFNDICIFVTG